MSVFTALKNIKKQRKFNIAPYGEIFYQLTYWRVAFLKSFLPLEFWDGLPVFAQQTIYHVHTEMRQILVVNILFCIDLNIKF